MERRHRKRSLKKQVPSDGLRRLCISGVIRLLRAAGVELGKAPGYQWYGTQVSIWDIPPEVAKKYRQYYLEEDRKAIDKIFPKRPRK